MQLQSKIASESEIEQKVSTKQRTSNSDEESNISSSVSLFLKLRQFTKNTLNNLLVILDRECDLGRVIESHLVEYLVIEDRYLLYESPHLS